MPEHEPNDPIAIASSVDPGHTAPWSSSSPKGIKLAISLWYQTCLQGFLRLDHAFCDGSVTALVAPEKRQQTQDTVQEQLGRFKMWAGNAGAHQMGRMSLDYRLREAFHMHEQAVELLESLNESLKEG